MIESGGLHLLVHQLHRLWCRDRARTREAVQQDAQTEEVIEVSVRDVDGCEVAMLQRNPIRERLGLCDGGQGVHQHRVVLTVYQGGGDRVPAQWFAERPGRSPTTALPGAVKTLTPSRFGAA
ncbi:MAG: hypothetical protein QOC85_3873 [Streptomyces sp.]|jgi:hypothetical protein|nr:hypothetical protein [Streptomyces sp.]